MPDEVRSPIKAIREKCIECCCGQITEVKLCACIDCALHPFRFGKNPYVKRTMTEEQKAAAAERLKLARERKEEND